MPHRPGFPTRDPEVAVAVAAGAAHAKASKARLAQRPGQELAREQRTRTAAPAQEGVPLQLGCTPVQETQHGHVVVKKHGEVLPGKRAQARPSLQVKVTTDAQGQHWERPTPRQAEAQVHAREHRSPAEL